MRAPTTTHRWVAALVVVLAVGGCTCASDPASHVDAASEAAVEEDSGWEALDSSRFMPDDASSAPPSPCGRPIRRFSVDWPFGRPIQHMIGEGDRLIIPSVEDGTLLVRTVHIADGSFTDVTALTVSGASVVEPARDGRVLVTSNPIDEMVEWVDPFGGVRAVEVPGNYFVEAQAWTAGRMLLVTRTMSDELRLVWLSEDALEEMVTFEPPGEVRGFALASSERTEAAVLAAFGAEGVWIARVAPPIAPADTDWVLVTSGDALTATVGAVGMSTAVGVAEGALVRGSWFDATLAVDLGLDLSVAGATSALAVGERSRGLFVVHNIGDVSVYYTAVSDTGDAEGLRTVVENGIGSPAAWETASGSHVLAIQSTYTRVDVVVLCEGP